MGRLFTIVVALGFCASMASAEVTASFNVNRDCSLDSHDAGGNVNGGAGSVEMRGAKASWEEDTSLHDWDIGTINAWIASNGGYGNVTKVELFIKPLSDQWSTAGPGTVTGRGICVNLMLSGVDWAEGDGMDLWTRYNWSEGRAAATFRFAQHYYKTEGGVKVDDLDQSVKWQRADGTQVDSLRDLYPDATALNSARWTPGIGAPVDVYYGVELDAGFWEALLDRGQTSSVRGVILWDHDDAGTNDNWSFSTRENPSGDATYLKVTMIPEPASMALLALGGLAMIRRRRQ